ncbi:MAG: glycosyltransferase family 39 protein [Candidatus Brocadiaceae bacterium]
MCATEKLSRNDIPYLTGLVLAGFFLFLMYIWAMPLIDPDEPRYASTARDMVVNGNWIVPHFNGVPRINKPPLFYWTVALSYKIFGINEFSSRLPSALAAIGTAIITYAWRKRYCGKFQDRSAKDAFWAGMILMTSPLFYFIARFCITDMLLTFFVSAALYVFFVEYTEHTSVGATGFQTSSYKRMLLYFLLAMVFLVKGHVGILLFILVNVSFLLFMRDFRYIRRVWYLPGFLLFLGIICAWGIPFWLSLGTQQITSLLSQETSGRFVSGYAHPEPFYYYLPVLIMGFFPLSPFLFLVFAHIIKRKNSMPLEEKRYLYFFSAWFVLTLVIFSLSRSKLMTYILPLSPSVALLTSSLSQWETDNRLGKWTNRVVWFILTTAMLIPVVLLATMHTWIPAKYGFSTPHAAIPLIIFFMGMLAALFAFFRERRFFPLQKVFCFTNGIFLTITLVYASHPLGTFRSTKELVSKCLSDKTTDYTLLNYSRIDSSLIFYSGKNVREVDKDSTDEEFLPQSNEPVCLVMSLRDYTKKKSWIQAMDFHVDCQNNTHVILTK